MRLLIFHQP